MPDFIVNKINALWISGGFLPHLGQRVAGAPSGVVVFLTTWIYRDSSTPISPQEPENWLGGVHFQIIFFDSFNKRRPLHTQ